MPSDAPILAAFGCLITYETDGFAASRKRTIGFPEGRVARHALLADLIADLKRDRDRCLKVSIHIGLPKTGTTYLQRRVFPLFEGVHFVPWESRFFRHDFQKIKFMAGFAHIEEIRSGFEQYLFTFDEEHVLISDESLTNPWDRGRTVGSSILTIKALFPGASILLTLRDQSTMLRSLYVQSLRRGWTLGPVAFLRWDERQVAFRSFDEDLFPHIDLAFFRYIDLVRLFAESFSRVTVLLYEELATRPESFIVKLEAALEAKFGQAVPQDRDHPRLGLVGVTVLRFLNHFVIGARRRFVVDFANKIDRAFYIEYEPFPTWLRKSLAQYFEESNRVLAANLVADIADYWDTAHARNVATGTPTRFHSRAGAINGPAPRE